MIRASNTVILTKEDQVNPEKHLKKDEVVAGAFNPSTHPHIDGADIVLYLSDNGNYKIIRDKHSALENLW